VFLILIIVVILFVVVLVVVVVRAVSSIVGSPSVRLCTKRSLKDSILEMMLCLTGISRR